MCLYVCKQRDESSIDVTKTEEATDLRIIFGGLNIIPTFDVDLAHLQGSWSNNMSNIFDSVNKLRLIIFSATLASLIELRISSTSVMCFSIMFHYVMTPSRYI